MDTISQKRCNKCGEIKLTSEFSFDKRYKTFYTSCKSCCAARVRAFRLKNPRTDRGPFKKPPRPPAISRHTKSIRHFFGIDAPDYQRMLDAQNGVCAICGQPETVKSIRGIVRNLSIDHDHETGELRGLLCNNCNIGIGNLKDDISILEKAIEYLRRYLR